MKTLIRAFFPVSPEANTSLKTSSINVTFVMNTDGAAAAGLQDR